jgi:hypothetical protein
MGFSSLKSFGRWETLTEKSLFIAALKALNPMGKPLFPLPSPVERGWYRWSALTTTLKPLFLRIFSLSWQPSFPSSRVQKVLLQGVVER